MSEREWTLCTVHRVVVRDGSCSACGGDRNLVQVTTKLDRPHLRMADLEDIVYFFMNAPLEKDFSKDILLGLLCKLNGAPYGDPGVALDIADWLARTEGKWRSRQSARKTASDP